MATQSYCIFQLPQQLDVPRQIGDLKAGDNCHLPLPPRSPISSSHAPPGCYPFLWAGMVDSGHDSTKDSRATEGWGPEWLCGAESPWVRTPILDCYKRENQLSIVFCPLYFGSISFKKLVTLSDTTGHSSCWWHISSSLLRFFFFFFFTNHQWHN